MDRQTILVLNLMAQMRAKALVSQALRDRGLSEVDLHAARAQAEQLGFHSLGHSMDLYSDALGDPAEVVEQAPEQDSASEARVELYRVQPWSPLLLAVRGSTERVTARVEFVGVTDVSSRVRSGGTRYEPWRLVESDWLECVVAPQVADDWYPMRDYIALGEQPKTEVLVQFDFGLLQQVFRRPSGGRDDEWALQAMTLSTTSPT